MGCWRKSEVSGVWGTGFPEAGFGIVTAAGLLSLRGRPGLFAGLETGLVRATTEALWRLLRVGLPSIRASHSYISSRAS